MADLELLGDEVSVRIDQAVASLTGAAVARREGDGPRCAALLEVASLQAAGASAFVRRELAREGR